MVSNMQIRQQELVHGEKQACDVADCMEEQCVKPSQGKCRVVLCECSWPVPFVGLPWNATWKVSSWDLCPAVLSCAQKVQNSVSPEMFYAQNRQGRKGSSGRESRNGLSIVPGELGTQFASPDL